MFNFRGNQNKRCSVSSHTLAFSSPYTPDLIVFLLFLCQIPVSVFSPPLSLDTLLSPSEPHLLRGGAAPLVKLVRVAAVDTIRMSPPRGMQECQAETETEGCRSCSNNSCTHTHIFPICSSLFITSHLHVLIS